MPDNALGQRVSGVLSHPLDRHGVLFVHPVSLPGMDLSVVEVSLRILLVQLAQSVLPLLGDSIPVVGRIQGSHMEGKRRIAKTQGIRVVGMTSHHGGRSPTIGQSRSDLINAISAGRISHHVHPVGIHVLQHHQIFDQAIEQGIDVTAMPHVPGVGGSPRAEVDSFGGLVQLQLIRPLPIVFFEPRSRHPRAGR